LIGHTVVDSYTHTWKYMVEPSTKRAKFEWC
jgi:hypothetical protein